MPPFSIWASLAAAVLAFPGLAGAAEAPAPDGGRRAEIEAVVHDYLLAHPDVIIEAVKAYQEKLEADKDKAAHEVLAKSSAQLLRDPETQSLGNVTSDCAVIEFFDNQCPYCQANEPVLQTLLKQDKRVRLVLKEYPILGPISIEAAKAALASVKQGKYVQFHEALLSHKGHYQNAAVVDEVAKSVGLDLEKLHKDMGAPEIAAEINANLELGRGLDITGTPGFIVGDQIIGGATDIDDLKKFVSAACKGSG